jgi:hypothetical protein
MIQQPSDDAFHESSRREVHQSCLVEVDVNPFRIAVQERDELVFISVSARQHQLRIVQGECRAIGAVKMRGDFGCRGGVGRATLRAVLRPDA